MNGDDLLTRATHALREASEVSPSEVAATRARILTTLRKSERRRSKLLVFVLPLAAMLAAGTALAKNDARFRGVWDEIGARLQGWRPAAQSADSAAPEKSSRAASDSASAEPPPALNPPVLDTPEPAPPAPPAPVAAKRPSATARQAVAAAGAGGARDERPVDVPLIDDEQAALTLYRRAHELHFRQQNDAEAVSAWDAYLQKAAHGRLAIEARYNRAIALLRLGRRGDAELALLPFARGEVSAGYRRDEARALLAAMGTSDAATP